MLYDTLLDLGDAALCATAEERVCEKRRNRDHETENRRDDCLRNALGKDHRLRACRDIGGDSTERLEHAEHGSEKSDERCDRAEVVIGKDTRRSSYMFEYALCTGLMASGADAYIMHVTTTPSVAYIARVDDFDCGIMISASHNPFYDNGIP